MGRARLVGVDGEGGSGKTVLADELAAVLTRPVLRAGIDHFHRPRVERYRRGREDPDGFYLDSYDLDAVRGRLLDPFLAGDPVVTEVFDHVVDRPVTVEPVRPAQDSVLIVDGLFLHRPELRAYWDLSVYLDVPTELALARCAARDGCSAAVADNRRYVEGHRRYLAECDPHERASIVVDNSDLARPRVVAHRHDPTRSGTVGHG